MIDIQKLRYIADAHRRYINDIHTHDFGYPGEEEPSSIQIFSGPFDWEAIDHNETEVYGALNPNSDGDVLAKVLTTFTADTIDEICDKLEELEKLKSHGGNKND